MYSNWIALILSYQVPWSPTGCHQTPLSATASQVYLLHKVWLTKVHLTPRQRIVWDKVGKNALSPLRLQLNDRPLSNIA